MTINEKRRDLIIFTMYKRKMTKEKLASLLNVSYPTMLTKINNPASLKLKECDMLCKALKINLNEFLTLK
tara:strand:- start:380 stop:589 length:210 start_codon:yes stop_codon:yes gene_type:complete